jgi:hypothetical protein
MQMQLTLDFTPRPAKQKPIIKIPSWMDVSDIARGVGFNASVEVSMRLSDELEPLHIQEVDEYDQHLYDALWLAHHYLSLDPRDSFTFTFDFLREDLIQGRFVEVSLRLRLEVQRQVVLLGLLDDF